MRAPCTAPAAVKSPKMPNKMLIDATHPEETRVVVVRGNRVEEFDFETAQRKQLRGNIYLAKVTRVEPSLQAAFIEYGGNRHGFLAFSEIHPDYYQIPVADRQALIEADERAHREAEEESENRSSSRHRGRSRHRNARRRGNGERVQSEVVRERRRRPLAGRRSPMKATSTPTACRPNRATRTTPSITTPTPNIMTIRVMNMAMITTTRTIMSMPSMPMTNAITRRIAAPKPTPARRWRR